MTISDEGREVYSVADIRAAFAKHASRDDWDVPSFYEGGLIAALRGEYDALHVAPCTDQTGHVSGSDHRWQECPTYHD